MQQDLAQNISQNGTFDISFTSINGKANEEQLTFMSLNGVPGLNLSCEEYRMIDLQLKKMGRIYNRDSGAKYKFNLNSTFIPNAPLNNFGGNHNGFMTNNQPGFNNNTLLNGNQYSFGSKSNINTAFPLNSNTSNTNSVFTMNQTNNSLNSNTNSGGSLWNNNNNAQKSIFVFSNI